MSMAYVYPTLSLGRLEGRGLVDTFSIWQILNVASSILLILPNSLIFTWVSH